MSFYAEKFEHSCHDFVSVIERKLQLKMKPVKATKRITKTSTSQNGMLRQPQPALPATRAGAAKSKPENLTAKTATATAAKEGRPAASPGPVTTIRAKIDVGFGNNLFVRGQGAGLSWERGIPLTCVDGQMWQWSGKADDRLTFKLLLNDQVWAKGEDIIVTPGQKVEVVPMF